LASCGGVKDGIVIAAGTTLDDSGFLGALVAEYQAEFPDRQVVIVGRSSAEAISLGTAGSADLLITHAPVLEAEFISAGLSSRDVALFESAFYLVAPPEIAAELAGQTVAEVLLGLVDRTIDADFVSRGDQSGTHHREQALWEPAGGVPHEATWYLETGQGMGPTLQIASQKGAVALTEAGSFLSVGELALVVVETSGPGLPNVYRAILPKGASVEAALFVDWVVAHPALVGSVNTDLFGSPVYRSLP
jgi:tungstate transport system substrate-binding protein